MIEDEARDDTTTLRILEERAQLLSRSLTTVAQKQGNGYVVLQLGKEKYGVPLAAVQEIRPVTDITRVPNTPAFYAGLVNLRGHLYPALNLRRYLGLEGNPADARTKLVLVSAASLDLCLVVDAVLDVRWIADTEIQPLPTDITASHREISSGITTDFITIVNLKTLLSDPTLIVQDQVV